MDEKKQQNQDVGQEEIAAKLPFGSFSIKGADIIGIGTFLLVGVGAWALYDHKEQTRDTAQNFTSAVKEMTHAQKQMVAAQREQNCLLIYPLEKREAAYEACKRIAR